MYLHIGNNISIPSDDIIGIFDIDPLEQVPLAGSTPLKGRQPEFYKYQSG